MAKWLSVRLGTKGLRVLISLLSQKKVSSLDQFLLYMNEEDIFDSFLGIGNVITSDGVRAVSL